MMNLQSKSGALFANEQFRMAGLQIFNWGTFSGRHKVPIAERGFLFVGRSGAGKSTLLDAISALLVPPRWVDFNAAARETDRSGRDRNLISYVRGAWGAQTDGDSGDIATQYLRSGTTWSALALTYRNSNGRTVVIVQVFWVRGATNANTDVRRQYLIFERDFDLTELEEFRKADFDVRKLKQVFPEAFVRDEFNSYCERYRRLLGIDTEMALRLLHKTQSAKNLGDLNVFLRDFMLDKPETFEVADRLVNEFGALNAAHQAVVTARQQVQMLVPAREKHQQMDAMTIQRNALDELKTGINNYREFRRKEMLGGRIAELTVREEGVRGERDRRQELFNNHSNELRDLERQHRENGGEKIEQWESDKTSLEEQRSGRLIKREQAVTACRGLGWILSDTPQGFAELKGKARDELEGTESKSKSRREERDKLAVELSEVSRAILEARNEVAALERQKSNIPSHMLELRGDIASAIGVSEESLPFVGELVEVKSDEFSWQGAIERLLRNFALSVLVDERHYQSLSNYADSTYLGRRRLVYYRVSRVDASSIANPKTDSVVYKLSFKDGWYSNWLQAELRQRFDYACVESGQNFRTAERALTIAGQIKHNKTRHEKDDRHSLDDRSNWVLGFDNREKLGLFKKRVQELSVQFSGVQEKIEVLDRLDIARNSRGRYCQTLVNLEWQEIDVAPLLTRISDIERLIREARDGNMALQETANRISTQRSLVERADRDLQDAKVEYVVVSNQLNDANDRLNVLTADLSIVPPTPHQKSGLDERYAQTKDVINLDNLDRATTSVVQVLNEDIAKINNGIGECRKNIENIFADFKRSWPMDAADLDSTISSAQDYFVKLARLESDGLPAHEQHFFDLLQKQSNQNLAALSTYLNDARKAILERMDLVNESLRQVPFNQSVVQTTYLRIDASDRQLPDVREFRQDIQQVLSHAWSDDRELAEGRFLLLREMVERLSSQESEQKRWRDLVLDVRQHVEFIGREVDEGDVEVEIYRSGAGKSGGQRQKLATTCLAAALRYQLGGNEHGVPMYAPVVLDEAFDKADNEFTALSMKIFNNFGFQMIVATPLKSVMTLEPFIGGACYVDINDRRKSGVLLIEYDDDRQRLNLPEHVHNEAEIEAP